MGRYNLAPQRVHQAATRLLEAKRLQAPPPWYDVIAAIPPSERLVRPALQRSHRPGKKASKLFQPMEIKYPEDKLREEFFGDHPWELARPRIVLEDDGKDYQKYDWSQIQQPGKMLDGESVVQRQQWLMKNKRLSRAEAYDMARKEFYAIRHDEDIERRIAKEEAIMVGAHFGKSPLEIGMELEDQKYEDWREWAVKEIAALKQMQGSVYTGNENDEAAAALDDSSLDAGLDELAKSLPATAQGQEAKGGAMVHP